MRFAPPSKSRTPQLPGTPSQSPVIPTVNCCVVLNPLSRQAARAGATLVVVEGYMDVIALVRAGFAHSVAPLGTALTDEQLHLLWRTAPEPILAFDGDTAGFKAAHRAAHLALPQIGRAHV